MEINICQSFIVTSTGTGLLCLRMYLYCWDEKLMLRNKSQLNKTAIIITIDNNIIFCVMWFLLLPQCTESYRML